MRIVRLMHFGPGYIRHLYNIAQPTLGALNYDAQKTALFSDFFSFSDSWEHWLCRLGVEAHDIPFGVAPLNAAYWRGRGQDPQPALATAAAILNETRPDVLFLSSLENWSGAAIKALRDATPSLRAVVGMAGVEVYHSDALGEVDAFVTCMKEQAFRLGQQGLASSFVPHAFEPRVLDQIRDVERTSAFTFLGNVHGGSQWHDVRRKVLEALVAECGLELYSPVCQETGPNALRFTVLTGAYWAAKLLDRVPGGYSIAPIGRSLKKASTWPGPPSWTSGRMLSQRAKPPVYGIDMYRHLAASGMTVNIHIGAAGPYAANMRLFEATGAGTCLLTDAKSDLSEYFNVGTEVVAFESVADAVAKAKALLRDPEGTAEIGRRGQARTLRDHSYEQRAPVLLSIFQAACKERVRAI